MRCARLVWLAVAGLCRCPPPCTSPQAPPHRPISAVVDSDRGAPAGRSGIDGRRCLDVDRRGARVGRRGSETICAQPCENRRCRAPIRSCSRVRRCMPISRRLIPEDNVRRSPNQKTAYIVRDGRWIGIRYVSMHWQLGRALLDSVVPDPCCSPGRSRVVRGNIGGSAAHAPVRRRG